jgi:hypothetical protein
MLRRSGYTPTRRWFGVLVFGMLLLSGVAAMAAPAGSVVGLNGQCFRESGAQRSPLKMGDAVAVGETVEVPAGGKLKLLMTDGSVIALASGSKMTIADYRADAGGQRQVAHLTLPEGLVRAVVAPAGGAPNFDVSTAVGTAAARSTDWFVEARAGAAQVGVLSGTVSLTSAATGRSETIPARWGARLEAGRDPVPARVWTQAEFDAFIGRTDIR